MDEAYSWLRRGVSKLKKTSLPSASNAKESTNKSDEEDVSKVYGITDRLIELVKSFNLDTFKSFSLPDDEGIGEGENSGNVRKDLSQWQERHAMLVLSRVKELAHLRFQLCPRLLKEQQFWRIYFNLVKSHVTDYELQAIRLAKLKQIAMENGTFPKKSACEVEMSETKLIVSENLITASVEDN